MSNIAVESLDDLMGKRFAFTDPHSNDAMYDSAREMQSWLAEKEPAK